MPQPGQWKFVDTAQRGVQTFITLTRGDQSELTAAFATAVAALTPTTNNTIVGYDPSGRPTPWRNYNP